MVTVGRGDKGLMGETAEEGSILVPVKMTKDKKKVLEVLKLTTGNLGAFLAPCD